MEKAAASSDPSPAAQPGTYFRPLALANDISVSWTETSFLLLPGRHVTIEASVNSSFLRPLSLAHWELPRTPFPVCLCTLLLALSRSSVQCQPNEKDEAGPFCSVCPTPFPHSPLLGGTLGSY